MRKELKHLLWLDLEMTGLRPLIDRITEVAAIVTDMDLNEVATYQTGVKHPRELLEKLTGESEWHLQQESYTREMIEHSLAGKPEQFVQDELLEFIKKYIGLSMKPENFPFTKGSLEAKGEIYLAGNSISADRAFIESWWPDVARVLDYRMLDVSSFKLWYEANGIKKFEKKNKHRALDDIRESIAEFAYYVK